MKRWAFIALLTIAVALAWRYQQQPRTTARLTATWLGPDWAEARSGGRIDWNRRIHLKNTGERDFIATVYGFAGKDPKQTFVEGKARDAIGAIDLGPGEAVATGVWSPDNPAQGVQVMAFSCSAVELKRRINLRARYPVCKILWPLPYYILHVGEYKPPETTE
jgi:hypothetical protein